MGNIEFIKVKYKEVDLLSEEGSSRFKSYFEECSKNYFDYLSSYFVTEGGVLKNEFRFINA